MVQRFHFGEVGTAILAVLAVEPGTQLGLSSGKINFEDNSCTSRFNIGYLFQTGDLNLSPDRFDGPLGFGGPLAQRQAIAARSFDIHDPGAVERD